mmetsp:Transcript_42260/g.69901  ORF Transcript_42260/g.69901 Transcript_42260/m.69901 type:complete len:84 (-) Transcript_42260:156-407(-)
MAEKCSTARCFCTTAFAQQPCLTEESTTAAYYGGKAYVKKKKIKLRFSHHHSHHPYFHGKPFYPLPASRGTTPYSVTHHSWAV